MNKSGDKLLLPSALLAALVVEAVSIAGALNGAEGGRREVGRGNDQIGTGGAFEKLPPGGDRLVLVRATMGSFSSRVEFLQVPTGREVLALVTHDEFIGEMRFDPMGRFLFVNVGRPDGTSLETGVWDASPTVDGDVPGE